MKVYEIKYEDYSPLIVSDIAEGLVIIADQIDGDPRFEDALNDYENGMTLVKPIEIEMSITVTVKNMWEEDYKNLPEWEP